MVSRIYLKTLSDIVEISPQKALSFYKDSARQAVLDTTLKFMPDTVVWHL